MTAERRRRCTRPDAWTAAEDALIREIYPDGGPEACVRRLQRRTLKAIMSRAAILGVNLSREENARRHRTGRIYLSARALDQKEPNPPLPVDDSALRAVMAGVDDLNPPAPGGRTARAVSDRAQLMTALSRHEGMENGISAEALARELDIPARQVRALVSDAREDGAHICAHPRTGYFMAANGDELERYYIDFLRNRALHSLKLISRAKNIALPELLGQLRLPT